eukprot:UN06944
MSLLHRQLMDEDDCKQQSDVGSTSSTPLGKMEVENTKTIENVGSSLTKKIQQLNKRDPKSSMDVESNVYKAEDFTSMLLTILENTQADPSEDDFLSTIEPFDGVDCDEFDFAYGISAKQEKVKGGSSSKKSAKKVQRRKRTAKKVKKSSRPTKTPKRVPSKAAPRTHISKNAEITDENVAEIARDFTYVETGLPSAIGKSSNKFKKRAGFDPFWSAKDVPLERLGEKVVCMSNRMSLDMDIRAGMKLSVIKQVNGNGISG